MHVHIDPLEALVIFLLWLNVSLAIGMLVGRIFRLNNPDDEDNQ